jgi:hypothetical protein
MWVHAEWGKREICKQRNSLFLRLFEPGLLKWVQEVAGSNPVATTFGSLVVTAVAGL